MEIREFNGSNCRSYALISQGRPHIEVFRRADEGWRYEVIEAGGAVRIGAGFAVNVDQLYRGVFDLPGDAR